MRPPPSHDPGSGDPGSGDPGSGDPGSRLEEILEEHGLQPPVDADAPSGDPAADRDPVDEIIAGSGRPPEEAGPAEDAAGDVDAGGADRAGSEGGGGSEGEPAPEPEPDPLPDAPLFALLRTVEREVDVDRIDRIWVFPPRRIEAGETSVVVVAAFPELDDGRRRVFAAHYTAPAETAEPRLALNEYGTAPTERVGRLVEEVVERLKDQPSAPPRAYRIEGDSGRWHATLHELAEKHLEEMEKNPRLRR